MKTIILSRGLETTVDDDVFVWASKYSWHIQNGYAARTGTTIDGHLRGKAIFIHREILILKYGDKGNLYHCDHIDNNKLNNTLSNLRWVTIQQNQFNSNLQKGVSKYKGVKKGSKNTWEVSMRIDKLYSYIGLFNDEISAAKAYDKEALKHRKEFAYLNFPELKDEYLCEIIKDNEKKEEQLKILNDNIVRLLTLQKKEAQIGI